MARDNKDLGHGERVLPGVYRLRLPLPFHGIPHGNAWAIAAGDGVVLFDTGIHQPGSWDNFERALNDVHLRVEHIRKLLLTHAHVDHCGQTAPIKARSGAEVWLHPNRRHATWWLEDLEGFTNNRREVADMAGVPVGQLHSNLARAPSGNIGIAGESLPVDHDLLEGMTFDTDIGTFEVLDTPGHAPSHVSFYNAEKSMLVMGDHVLGKVSLFWDYGFTPDPVQEYIDGLDKLEALDARLALSGHGRTFTEVNAHIAKNREALARMIDSCEKGVANNPNSTPFELAPHVFGVQMNEINVNWLMTMQLCLLQHLENAGRIVRTNDVPQRFVRA